METTRRNMLRSSSLVSLAAVGAVTGVVGQVSSCSNSAQQLTQQVIDAIQAGVATGCSFVPSVLTILAIANQFPAINGATTIAADTLTEIQKFLCGSFESAGGVNAAIASKSGNKMLGKLKSGTTFEVHGLVYTNGKFVQF